jgi:hypothetical protein
MDAERVVRGGKMKNTASLVCCLCVVCFACSPAKRADDARDKGTTPQSTNTVALLLEDAVLKEIHAFRKETRQWYNNRRFDELERRAEELRVAKAAFGNGRWKIQRFYDALECADSEPESMWLLHKQIHEEWLAKKPESVTARVAFADFWVSYAWHARGSKFAKDVTDEGWRLFGERLDNALKIVNETHAMPAKDPYLWSVALSIALGQGWDEKAYDALMREAHSVEPLFWSYDTARAYSLLPRWHGQPGDWERYARISSVRNGGVGAETYARIVIHLMKYYGNIFNETQASWSLTRKGFEAMFTKYPSSEEVIQFAALLAFQAGDRDFAKPLADRMGNAYLKSVWGKPERFQAFQAWMATTRR